MLRHTQLGWMLVSLHLLQSFLRLMLQRLIFSLIQIQIILA